MPIYDKHKCIFFHIPKSAGSSIYKALDGKGYSTHKKHLISKENENYFKFTFVRNPFDRFVSTYFYFKKYGRDGRGDVKMGDVVNRFNFFKDFVINFDKIPETEWCYPHWKQQMHWIHKDIDFVGRFENLQQDFNTICDKIGIPRQQLPHKLKSKHKHYTEYYDDETKQIVAEKYAKDIDYFGYKFG
jgi:hypothetical protein